jgi:hypothetical protein
MNGHDRVVWKHVLEYLTFYEYSKITRTCKYFLELRKELNNNRDIYISWTSGSDPNNKRPYENFTIQDEHHIITIDKAIEIKESHHSCINIII